MAKLWNDEDTFVVTEAGNLLRKASDAIKRVRELHAPIEATELYPHKTKYLSCSECVPKAGSGLAFVRYPCQTIQALEGETE
jgi:hypothetical protein